MSNKETILAELQPMFAVARAKGLWFHCHYQDLWFSPDELEEKQRAGAFIWGAVNWRLSDPREKLGYLDKAVQRARADAENFRARLEGTS